MIQRGVSIAVLATLILQSLAAKQPLELCGTFFERTQEALFLHSTSLAKTSQRSARVAAIPRDATRDSGDVVVMANTDGILVSPNGYNLSGVGLQLQPTGAGYQRTIGNATLDESITTAGVRLPLDDDDTERVALPFYFRFFGVDYNEVWVNSNGTLTFGGGDTDYSGTFGHFVHGRPTIAASFADLDPAVSTAGVRVVSTGSQWAVTWVGVPLSGSASGSNTMQVRLFPSGRVELSYGVASLPEAVVGITPGGGRSVPLVHLTTPSNTGYPDGVAEVFASSAQVDLIQAAQTFFQTHEDAYDFLVFFDAESLTAPTGPLAYSVPVRSKGSGYGISALDQGADFGSPGRLQSVINMGALSVYPTDPLETIGRQFPTPDSTVTQLAHQMGHLFLSHVSVLGSEATNFWPMLTSDFGHWSFNYNSEASVMGGNLIVDRGAATVPRFETTAAVRKYSPMDQYLMGLRSASEVPASFVVTQSTQSAERVPEVGVRFSGARQEVTAQQVAQVYGARRPDSTVAQNRFRAAFVVIVPATTNLDSLGALSTSVTKVDGFRRALETFFVQATDSRAILDTAIRKAVNFSLAPNSGLVQGQDQTVTLQVAQASGTSQTFSLVSATGRVRTPATVSVPAGATQVQFSVTGTAAGVDDFIVTPANPAYQTVTARVQVRPLPELSVQALEGDQQDIRNSPISVVARVGDANQLGFGGIRVIATPSVGGAVMPSDAVSDAAGLVRFEWVPAPGLNTDQLRLAGENAPQITTLVKALGPGVITPGGFVNAASYFGWIAPGTLASIFGENLSAGVQAQLGSLPFPSELGGVRVRINGLAVPLYWVSDQQINFYVPLELATGPSQLIVETRIGTSAIYGFLMTPESPGIFYDAASGYGAVVVVRTGAVTQVTGARGGDFLEIYGTGLGPVRTGIVPATTTSNIYAEIGGLEAAISFSGMTGTPGLYQVNVKVPSGLPPGDQPLILRVNGTTSNTVKVRIISN